MKIGIFGDSFADSNWKPTLSWSHYLAEILQAESIVNFGRSGTSHWWSFEQFLKHYKEFDVVVFCHTVSARWPSLPEEYEGYHWDVGHGRSVKHTPEYLQKINRVFLDIFPEPLLNAISEHIFRKVDELCREANISLVHLTVGKPNYDAEKYSSYPVLADISNISFTERTIHNGKDINFWEQLSKLNIPDVRPCHLLPANNAALAKLIVDCIKNNNGSYCNLNELSVWHTHDPITNDWFK